MLRSRRTTRQSSSLGTAAAGSASTVHEHDSSPHGRRLSSGAAGQAHAWLKRQLHWEQSLAELRADHERATSLTNAPTSAAEQP
jgi:hypothetical protein